MESDRGMQRGTEQHWEEHGRAQKSMEQCYEVQIAQN